MTASELRIAVGARLIAAALAMSALVTVAHADIVQRESDITALRLGQRVYIDDGSCPAGQIKEIVGKKLTSNGVGGTRQCVDRKGKR